jgi:hypothetical protein
MTIAFDYLNDSHVLVCFFKVVSRSRLCQRLEERELRSLEEHPPLADLRPIHFASNLNRALGERSCDSTTPYKCGNLGS